MNEKGLILQMVEDTFNTVIEDHEREKFNYSNNRGCKFIAKYELELDYHPEKEAFSFELEGNCFEVPKNWSAFSSLLLVNNYGLVSCEDSDDLAGLISSVLSVEIGEIILKHDQRRVKLTPKAAIQAA